MRQCARRIAELPPFLISNSFIARIRRIVLHICFSFGMPSRRGAIFQAPGNSAAHSRWQAEDEGHAQRNGRLGSNSAGLAAATCRARRRPGSEPPPATGSFAAVQVRGRTNRWSDPRVRHGRMMPGGATRKRPMMSQHAAAPILKAIPSTGQMLPVVGLGTNAFCESSSPAHRSRSASRLSMRAWTRTCSASRLPRNAMDLARHRRALRVAGFFIEGILRRLAAGRESSAAPLGFWRLLRLGGVFGRAGFDSVWGRAKS